MKSSFVQTFFSFRAFARGEGWRFPGSLCEHQMSATKDSARAWASVRGSETGPHRLACTCQTERGRRGTCSRSVPPLRRNKGNLNAGFYFHGQRREKKSSWATAAHMKPRTVRISEAEGVRIERDALFMSGRR